MFSFLSFVASFVLFIMLLDTRSRLSRAEVTLQEAARRIGALQRQAAAGAPAAPEPEQVIVQPPAPPPPPPHSAQAHTTATPQAIPTQRLAPVEPEKPFEPVIQPEPAVAAPAPDHPARRPRPERTGFGFEELFGRKLPIWAGGITLAIAGVLIVKYAVDLGLFGRIFPHGVQVVCGLLFGGGLIAGADLAWRNEAHVRDVRVPQALSGAGIASLYASVLLAANAYALLAPLPAFVALAAITAGALALSLRFGAPSAVLGLAGGLAAPALVGSMSPNVPLLAVYLGLTIAGLAGVARRQGWAWLGVAALLGGAGWSLFVILATGALDAAASLSLGGLLLLLGIVVPVLAFDGPRGVVLRSAAAAIGCIELAVLVATGGFAPLHWGLFALLALAGQWLAWHQDDTQRGNLANAIRIVPTISLALSALLLAIWPHPDTAWFAEVGLALAAIHALPLLVRRTSDRVRAALELCALALAAPLLTRWHFPAIGDDRLAWITLAAAALPGVAIALGWRADNRRDNPGFAVQSTCVALMLALAMVLVVPAWLVPLGLALIAAGLLGFGQAASARTLEPIAFAFALATVPALLVTMPLPGELACLVAGAGPVSAHALIRWGGLTVLFTLFAARAQTPGLRGAAQVCAALLGYATMAQALPAVWLPLVPVLAGVALLFAGPRLGWARMSWAVVTFAGLSLGWAIVPLAQWTAAATLSLSGLPMTFDAAMPGLSVAVRCLLLPALLFGFALWALRDTVPDIVRKAGAGATAGQAVIAGHCLYRLGFAAVFGADFAATGLGERVVWEAVLIGGGWFAWRRGAMTAAQTLALAGTWHAVWYTLLLHNPLWATQAVGPAPLANLLIPAFALAPLGLALLLRLSPDHPPLVDRLSQGVRMVLIVLFAWATLRQGFHGSVLNVAGAYPAENILRSLLILALAIGYLQWGIRKAMHDWRIASLVLMLAAVGKVFLFDASGLEGLLRIGSFVALGFSLIGIGWLYSRQLSARIRDE